MTRAGGLPPGIRLGRALAKSHAIPILLEVRRRLDQGESDASSLVMTHVTRAAGMRDANRGRETVQHLVEAKLLTRAIVGRSGGRNVYALGLTPAGHAVTTALQEATHAYEGIPTQGNEKRKASDSGT